MPATRPAHGRLTLLFVHSPQCEACAEVRRTLATLRTSGALQAFDLVELDADAKPLDVAALEVTTTPTLRVLDADGTALATAAGPMEPAAIRALLAEAIARRPGPALVDSPDAWFAALDGDDAGRRDQAIERIVARNDLAPAVVERFAKGEFRVRLALLDVLRRWSAPIDGLDPWLPETVNDASLATLRDWSRARLKDQRLPTDGTRGPSTTSSTPP